MSHVLHSVPPPVRGDIVHVRSRCHVVESTTAANYGTTVELACLEDSAQGELSSVLWEAELAPRIITEQAWDSIGKKGFDTREYFSSFFNTLRWHCVTATDPSLFQSPFRAGIKLDAYQLEPLSKALRLPRVNLFIADDVGLGKTIEAGLIAAELLLRKRIKNVVVSCPPSMLYQWKAELDSRFGLTFEILDREYIERVRQEQGFAVNPWTTYPHFLVSHRLLIDDTYAEPLKQWLGSHRSQSLFILDEAHHAAPASASKYAIDSRFTRAIRSLSQRFEHRLFLSATPHNGHSNSFSALLEILDPQRFTRGVPVVKANLNDVMVRRLKNDIRLLAGGFPERIVDQIDIDDLPADAPELTLIEMMDRYQALRSEQVQGEKKHIRNRSLIVFSHLQQRLLSSPEAFARTITKHAAGAPKRFNPKAKLQLISKGVDPDSEEAGLDEDAQEALLANELAKADPIEKLNDTANALLQDIVRIANEARYKPDAKTTKLIEWIAQHQCEGVGHGDHAAQLGSKWTNTRVIIFTEWDASLTYLRNMLGHAIAGTDQADARIEIYRGSTSIDRREEIKDAFNEDPNDNPVRILLATDAAREGLNLQAHCCHLFHYDVPWNPSRLEQRNGRIDRKLQPEDKVYCHYFFYKQRPQDRVLKALVRKTATIEEELGSLAQVLEKRLTSKLEFGIASDQIDFLAAAIANDTLPDQQQVTREELEGIRDRQDVLKAQVQRLENRITQAKRWINYSHAGFEQALSCSLKLANYSPLSPFDSADEDASQLYHFPNLNTGQGLDPTWGATLDTLRQPPKKGKRDHRWRSESPIRPIRFTAPDTIDEKSVQLHLGHRIAKRLLSRFLSQGFIHHDMSRACLGQSDDAIPRVVLLGRLGLFGKGATRLHEEIITITARWDPPEKRSGNPLKAYARDAEARTMEILENSLLAEGHSLPQDVQSLLLASIEADVAELRPLLDARAEDAEMAARLKLAERAEAEAKAIDDVLTAQKKRVETTLKRSSDDDNQLTLGFNDEEKRQLEQDKRYWKKWLETVDQDLINEPARIREFYEIQTARVEPIGLVYLWPSQATIPQT
ncbi:MAG: DISARM system SNF2-like helicase DrmD [Verrucomicrobiales bacterium]